MPRYYSPKVSKPWNNLIGALGDSRLANSGNNGTSENRGPLHWACAAAGQRLWFNNFYNFAVGGYTSADVVANKLTAACASPPASFFVLIGTNDRTSLTRAQSIANIERIVTALVGAGKDVYIMAELPRGNSGFPAYRFNASQLADHMAVRDYILGMRGRPSVYVCDAWSDIGDRLSTTGDCVIGSTIDGLHPNAHGAFLIAKSIAAQIIGRYPVAPTVSPQSNGAPNIWLNANPMLDGTGGSSFGTGGSGVLATGWKGSVGSTAGAITRVYSKTPEGYQKITFGAGKPSGAKAQLDLLTQSQLHTNIPAGSSVVGVADMGFDAGAVNVLSLAVVVMVIWADGTTHSVVDGDAYNDLAFLPSAAFNGIYRTPPIAVPAGATDVRLYIRAYTSNANASTDSTPSASFIVRSAGLRVV